MALSDYKQPSVTTDIVIFSMENKELKILLVKRGEDPFIGRWALPGGFVKMDEDLAVGAARELKEETGVSQVYLEQLYTFGDVGRDPRGRVITVAYMALVKNEGITLSPATDVVDAKWFPVNKLPSLAFDHKKILDYSVKRLKWKFEYTPVAFSLLPKQFTVSQLKEIYDIVFEKEFDKRNFYKKVSSLNILNDEGMQEGVAFRPAKLHSLKKDIPEIIGII